MSLTRLRSAIHEAERVLDSHSATTRSHGDKLRARLHAAWPWLWLGSGAALGAIAEQRMSMPATAAVEPVHAGKPSPSPSLFASLPWGLMLAVLDRALALAAQRDRSPQQ